MLRSEFPAGTKEGAVKWIIRPTVTKDWRYAPVVQASQVGYHPGQKKVAVIELDKRDTDFKQPALYRIAADGRKLVKQQAAKDWGDFQPVAGGDYEEALAALVMLGFGKAAADKVVKIVARENPGASVEDLVRMSLKRL